MKNKKKSLRIKSSLCLLSTVTTIVGAAFPGECWAQETELQKALQLAQQRAADLARAHAPAPAPHPAPPAPHPAPAPVPVPVPPAPAPHPAPPAPHPAPPAPHPAPAPVPVPVPPAPPPHPAPPPPVPVPAPAPVLDVEKEKLRARIRELEDQIRALQAAAAGPAREETPDAKAAEEAVKKFIKDFPVGPDTPLPTLEEIKQLLKRIKKVKDTKALELFEKWVLDNSTGRNLNEKEARLLEGVIMQITNYPAYPALAEKKLNKQRVFVATMAQQGEGDLAKVKLRLLAYPEEIRRTPLLILLFISEEELTANQRHLKNITKYIDNLSVDEKRALFTYLFNEGFTPIESEEEARTSDPFATLMQTLLKDLSAKPPQEGTPLTDEQFYKQFTTLSSLGMAIRTLANTIKNTEKAGFVKAVAANTATPTGGPATPTGGPATPTGGPATPTGGPATPTGGPATPTGGPVPVGKGKERAWTDPDGPVVGGPEAGPKGKGVGKIVQRIGGNGREVFQPTTGTPLVGVIEQGKGQLEIGDVETTETPPKKILLKYAISEEDVKLLDTGGQPLQNAEGQPVQPKVGDKVRFVAPAPVNGIQLSLGIGKKIEGNITVMGKGA